ncbi:copper chaperone PCu(A)C [Meiothermus sp. QL-1]|uniref:copper chaperone PCu(A)C n=1 Tax=Meiothermus sp. QL-1 TaxID=2058095 RepID=UPI000E0AF445|nr:copper chaperone PCu(A)C [Meiothermus sp. QL-1]RDI95195.1 copper chaperone PCu(A)C [Meiothermus sp. QL-1]
MRWTALLVLMGVALAQPLRLEQGWVRRVPGDVTAAYMVLYNPGDRPVRIVGASSPIASRVEFHQTTRGGHDHHADLSAMRRVAALVVPARGRLEVLPGGYHLMLYGLREKNPRPLQEGQRVAITLRLEGGGSVTFSLPVETR